MWIHIKAWVADLWGMTTTMVLAILVAAVPALNAIDAALLPAWAKLCIALAGVGVAVLRVVAPPPPAIPVKQADSMVVDHAQGTITISKAEDIPATTVSKLAGE